MSLRVFLGVVFQSLLLDGVVFQSLLLHNRNAFWLNVHAGTIFVMVKYKPEYKRSS